MGVWVGPNARAERMLGRGRGRGPAAGPELGLEVGQGLGEETALRRAGSRARAARSGRVDVCLGWGDIRAEEKALRNGAWNFEADCIFCVKTHGLAKAVVATAPLSWAATPLWKQRKLGSETAHRSESSTRRRLYEARALREGKPCENTM